MNTRASPASIRWAIDDLAVAVEQLDRSHLAQVHAHRVVGLLELLGDRPQLGLRLTLGFGLGLHPVRDARPRPRRLGVHDVDVELVQAHVDVVELFGDPGDLFRQVLVQLLVHDEATLLAGLDQLAELGVLLFNLHVHNPPVWGNASWSRGTPQSRCVRWAQCGYQEPISGTETDRPPCPQVVPIQIPPREASSRQDAM